MRSTAAGWRVAVGSNATRTSQPWWVTSLVRNRTRVATSTGSGKNGSLIRRSARVAASRAS